eukprot:scaffold121_cov412-Prasinococcus_capsulatus_cf.AAC.14
MDRRPIATIVYVIALILLGSSLWGSSSPRVNPVNATLINYPMANNQHLTEEARGSHIGHVGSSVDQSLDGFKEGVREHIHGRDQVSPHRDIQRPQGCPAHLWVGFPVCARSDVPSIGVWSPTHALSPVLKHVYILS